MNDFDRMEMKVYMCWNSDLFIFNDTGEFHEIEANQYLIKFTEKHDLLCSDLVEESICLGYL